MDRVARIAAAALTIILAASAVAQEPAPRPWREARCERYGAAASEFLARRGMAGLGASFLDAHAAFLASRCAARGAICPGPGAETEVANAMTVLAMNAGAASTFVPFRCP